jgi:hypothetical protein
MVSFDDASEQHKEREIELLTQVRLSLLVLKADARAFIDGRRLSVAA